MEMPLKYLYLNSHGKFTERIGKGTDNILVKLMLNDHDHRFPGEKIYYTRHWVDEDGLEWVDFGSWSTFYVISDHEIKFEKS